MCRNFSSKSGERSACHSLPFPAERQDFQRKAIFKSVAIWTKHALSDSVLVCAVWRKAVVAGYLFLLTQSSNSLQIIYWIIESEQLINYPREVKHDEQYRRLASPGCQNMPKSAKARDLSQRCSWAKAKKICKGQKRQSKNWKLPMQKSNWKLMNQLLH